AAQVAPAAAPAPAPLPRCEPAKLAIEEPGRFSKIGFESKRRETSDDVCGVADSNLARAEAAILALPAPVPAAARPAWDRKQPPRRLDLMARRFGLSAAERKQIARDGFVVTERLAQPSWGWAFHEIYQSQVPVYVSADAILHAVYAAHDGLV